MKNIPILNEGHPQEFVQFRAFFPDGVEKDGFSYGAIILTNKKTAANYMLELAGLKYSSGIYTSTFKPKTGATDAFSQFGHEINFGFTPAMLLSPDDIEAVCYLESTDGVKPDLMALVVDLHDLGGKPLSIINVSYVTNE